MVGGKKVAGVLCEAASGSSAGSGEGVVAGIGINVRTPAGGFALDIVSRATSLETEVVAPVSRAALAGAVLAELKRASDPGGLTLSPEALVDLNCRDVLCGQRVHTEQEGNGIARGIVESGALLLERDDGSRVGVVAGSVRLP